MIKSMQNLLVQNECEPKAINKTLRMQKNVITPSNNQPNRQKRQMEDKARVIS